MSKKITLRHHFALPHEPLKHYACSSAYMKCSVLKKLSQSSSIPQYNSWTLPP